LRRTRWKPYAAVLFTDIEHFTSITADFGTRVLICERTADLIGGRFALRARGAQRVHGFAHPLRVFEPLAERGLSRVVGAT